MVQRRVLNAETLAQTLALSSRTFSRKLKEEGATLPQLRTEVGLEYAEVLLLETNNTIAQVANAAGFANATAFARAFKRANGRTPSDWRTGLGQTEVASQTTPTLSVAGTGTPD